MVFINEGGFIAGFIMDMTMNLTGSLFVSLLVIMFFFILVAMLFRLPMEVSAVILLPLFLSFMAATSEFVVVGGVILIYLGIIFAKNFFLK